jgi:hypothetical protein
MQKNLFQNSFNNINPWAVVVSIVEGFLISSTIYIFTQDLQGRKFGLLLIGFLVIAVIGLYLLNHLILLQMVRTLPDMKKRILILAGLLISIVVCFNFFASIPDLKIVTRHTLKVQTVNNDTNSGTQVVELRSFSSGKNWESFGSYKKEGTWETNSDSMVSSEANAAFTWTGNISDKPVITFQGRPDGGVIRLTADGNDQGEVDLKKEPSELVNIYPVFNTTGDVAGKAVSILVVWLTLFWLAAIVTLLLFQNDIFLFGSSKIGESRFFKGITSFFNGKQVWTYLSLVLFCGIVTYLQVGNFNGRLGSVNGDDAPIVYSLLLNHPERFTTDILSVYGYPQLFATILNIIPAYLDKFFAISPVNVSLIIVYLQYILIGISVFKFSRVISGKDIVGWLAVFLVFAASPWDWNFANYGNVLYIPYAGHFVMAFVLFAFTDIVLKKDTRAILWLFLGGLAHPSMVMYASGMIAIYWLLKRDFSIRNWILLFANLAVTVLPRMLLVDSMNSANLLSFDEMKGALTQNLHMPALNLQNLTWRNKGFIGFLPLVFLALRDIKKIEKTYGWMLLSIAAGCFLLVLSSWVGWTFNILYIIQLIPNRSTQVFVFAAIPIVIVYFYNNLNDRRVLTNVFSIGFLVALCNGAFMSSPLYFSLLGVLFILDINSGWLGPISLRKFIKSEENNILEDQTREKISRLPVMPFAAIALTLVCVFGSSFYYSYKFGEEAQSDKSLAKYDIQDWVSKNTPEKSVVINMGRTVTQRAAISTDPYNWYVYNRSRLCKDYVDRFDAFYSRLRSGGDVKVNPVNLTSEQLAQFAQEFGGDYIFSPVDKPLDFSEAYRNDYYVLYKIQ